MSAIYPLSVHRRIERQWAERVKSLKTIHGQIVLAAVPKPSAALKWRGELLLLPLLSCFPYASERLGHTSPALCPVCALLACVPLGPRPWLRRLRRRLPGIVRRLHGYYGGVRLPTVVHHRLRLLAFPMRTRAARVTSAAGRPWDLPVPLQEASAHARVCDHAGSSRRSLMARPCVWPSTFGTVSAPRMIGLSRFNGWPVHSPADAFAGALAGVCARLGADVDRYSFTVWDLHPLLLAGLPAHSENLHTNGHGARLSSSG